MGVLEAAQLLTQSRRAILGVTSQVKVAIRALEHSGLTREESSTWDALAPAIGVDPATLTRADRLLFHLAIDEARKAIAAEEERGGTSR